MDLHGSKGSYYELLCKFVIVGTKLITIVIIVIIKYNITTIIINNSLFNSFCEPHHVLT